MQQCVIFDLDGTLADLRHRLHHVKGKNRNYDKFFAECGKDLPIWQTIKLARILKQNGQFVVIASARSDSCREETEMWLRRQGVPYDMLIMRKQGDYREDSIVKQEILGTLDYKYGYTPWIVVDDRKRVVDMWRKNGIMTLQVSDWEEREVPNRIRVPVLHVLIGPTGAGKTTLAEEHWNRDMIVSSDRIREELLGDPSDQSKNNEVFEVFHSLIKRRLDLGLDTVADATSIRRKDRMKVAKLNGENTVNYWVINRPMEEKKETRGWRWDELMERHENTFKSNLKYILNGDGLPNVKIVDMRNKE